jgi:hypothetical protein
MALRRARHDDSSPGRLGWFKAVHVKAPSAQEMRALLNARRFLVDELAGVENSMRAALCNFGLKCGSGAGTVTILAMCRGVLRVRRGVR